MTNTPRTINAARIPRTVRQRAAARRRAALGATCAVAAGMLIPALGQAAQAAEGDAPLADYLFTQTTGADVADAGGGAPATVQHADDSQWTG
ncbi:hypothetical protein, partial [Microbacterium gubbeenense]